MTQSLRIQVIALFVLVSVSLSFGTLPAVAANSPGSQSTPTAQPTPPPPPENTNVSLLQFCTGCHGETGYSISPDIPNLAGHSKSYLTNRIFHFLAPDQPGPMPDTLKLALTSFNLKYDVTTNGTVLPSSELRQAVNYVADFMFRQSVQPQPADFLKMQMGLSSSDKALYRRGKAIVSQKCVVCHLEIGYRPLNTLPMIFGQRSTYLTERLKSFKEGKGGTIMPLMLKNVPSEDIASVVVYLNNTHPTQGKEFR